MQKQNNDKKGFGGLSNLSSDIDDLLNSKEKNQSHILHGEQNKTNNNQNNKGTGLPNWFWIIILIILIWIMILAIVFGALYFRVANTTTYGLSNESDNAQSDSYIMQNSVLPDDYQETASFKKDSYAVQKDNYLDDYYESKPNKYTQTLNRNELLYCMAEAIRIDAVRYKIDSYSKSEVDRYNLFINNYNDICYSKQYYEKDENYVQK